ncbi:sterol desaturase family protein [Dokdonella fugitiva]|jgi:sterol desaturase/sphingolipid hydroxylase (fatty acid hydroxylase superfamily)|uniref:Sterol desaturase/sphingolipid hydroxylase (Fatty acid hydroxylase superfamily) n=1 Tax=Dokdonella fugitiva TaxID=328517 RepID=A0A4R2IG90_9GAMM|nr:sterol desaturase family protein [Dokdonella fugitiva]MBA8882792.1 sterol desaturase/sphingolipid hydroxylase (fatty acid hydroxylase superfamily) [Dokdonella fugitiva]TCO43232.1 sterol desaturase/sphingolipid hydroxylase (fatty acid hydroxylase superfamily) [Dokdonella fugitiva]
MYAFWNSLVDGLDAHAVTPFLAFAHLTGLAGDPREIAEALLIALAQVLVIGLVFRPLESLAPAERWADRRLARIDRTYTLLMLLGLNPLFAYLVLTPFANAFGGGAEEAASGLAAWLPWFQQHPLALFLAYYAIYDFAYYWMHRAQHWIPWWWALHSMHHSQRQMSCWSNDRGSYVDGVLQSIFLATVGLVVGVGPDQFALLMFVGELVQNWSHANVRFGFGRVLEKLFVDPKFHRLHHMIVDPERPRLHDCNYGQVLSIWDVLFGTALYGEPPRPTGVGDPIVDADNGRGVIAMQWGAFRRFWGAFWCAAGWKPGDVAFGPDYVPVPTRHMDLHRFDRAAPVDAPTADAPRDATAIVDAPVGAPARGSA